MNKTIAALFYPDAPKPVVYCYVVALSLSYIIVLVHTPLAVYAYAPFDDGLFISLGQSLAMGRWLGPFSEYTLAKGPGYPAFLALSHWLGTPITLSHALFHCAATTFFVAALHRLHGSLTLSGLLLMLLMWHPISVTVYLLRVFRDEIYYSLTLVVLAAAIWTLFGSSNKKQVMLFATLTGLLLGWFWLTREEGAFILPGLIFLAAGAAVRAWHASPSRLPELGMAILLIIGTYGATQIGFRTLNLIVYGSFVGVDVKEANFQRALKALHSVRSAGVQPFVSITKAARERVYAVSPTFASLSDRLESPDLVWAGETCRAIPTACGEVGSGWFMFALRWAAAIKGHYTSPAQASAFFGQMADEISGACARGDLECSPQLLSEMPQASWQQIATGFWQSAAKAIDLLLLTNPALQFNPSLGSEDDLDAALRFLNQPVHTGPVQREVASSSYSLMGWYYRAGSEWIELQLTTSDGLPADMRVERLPSPDLQRAFNDPDAAKQRFRIWTRCSDQCVMQFQVAGQYLVKKTLAELLRTPNYFDIDTGRVYVDRTTVRPNPVYSAMRTEEISNTVRKAIATSYKLFSLPILFLGACAFVILTLFRLRKSLSSLSYVVAFTCLMLVAMRTGLVILIDVTSFPALKPAYLAPAYFLLLSAAVLACAAWLQVALGLPPPSEPAPKSGSSGSNA